MGLVTGRDPAHWLHRLDAGEWLAAACNELDHALDALRAKRQREGVTYARRAAGMALNAALVARPDERYGRSYMEHLKALRADDGVPPAVREAAARLLAAPMQAELVTIGPGAIDLGLDAARVIEYARALVNGDSA